MALPLLMALAAGAQGVSKIAAGFQASAASKAQALGAGIERDMAMLRRTQLMGDSRGNILTALGNLSATQASRGAGIDGPTAQLIERTTVADMYRDEARASLGELTRAGDAEQARRGYRSAARWAVPMAVLSSVGDFAQAAAPFTSTPKVAPKGGK